MNIVLNQIVVDELRRMFIDGATPSRLMQIIRTHHTNDDQLRDTIKDYFTEAFGIQLLRHVTSDIDYAPDIRHAHFNRDVTSEIVENIGEWNTSSLEGSWLERISVRSQLQHKERLRSTHFEDLDRVWDILNDDERRFVINLAASNDHSWEVMKLLAAIAERLQQKLVDLECQSSGESE